MVSPVRFQFDQEHCCIYDLQTNKSYEVLFANQHGNEAITQVCIEILQTLDNNFNPYLNNLQDVEITKNKVNLNSDVETPPLDQRVQQIFEQKLTEILSKIAEDKPIVIKEITNPLLQEDINKFFIENNYSSNSFKEIFSILEKLIRSEDVDNPVISKMIHYRGISLHLYSQIEQFRDKSKKEIINEADVEKLSRNTLQLKNVQILILLSLLQYIEKNKSLSSRLLSSLTSYFKEEEKPIAERQDLLNHLSRTLKMQAFREKLSPLDNQSVRSFIRQSVLSEMPLLEEIEQAKQHLLMVENALEGVTKNQGSLRLRHELQFTKSYLFSKQRLLLTKMREKLIDSIPKTRGLTEEEKQKLIEIDKMAMHLTHKVNEANTARKRLKKEHGMAVKEGQLPLEAGLLKTPKLQIATDFAKAMLKTDPATFASIETWEPLKQVTEVSFGESIYNAVKEGLQKLQAFSKTSLALKKIMRDLQKEIDHKETEIKEINKQQDILKSEKEAKIGIIQNSITDLKNKLHLVNLQRQNNELVKITDDLGFLNYFIQKSEKTIATKMQDLQEEESKLQLYELFLKNPEPQGKEEWLSAEMLKISKANPTLLQNLQETLPIDKIGREKYLNQHIEESKKRIGELNYSMDMTKQEIRKAKDRTVELDIRFKSFMNKYEAEWMVIPAENVYAKLTDWAKNTLLKSISFGMIKSVTPPHPQQLRMKKEYADAGYNFYHVMEEWKKEVDSISPTEQKVYYQKMMDEFYEWAYTHPATATQLAGDIALTLSVINPNKVTLDHILTSLQAKTFAFTMLQEVGVKDMPLVEDKKFLKFKALADLCRYLPHITGSAEPAMTAAQNTLMGAAFGGSFGAFLGILGGVKDVVFNSAKTSIIQEQIDSIQGKDSANYLFAGRVLRKMVQSQPYVDGAIERETLKLAKDAITAVHAVKRPEGIGPYLVSKISTWWNQVKAAPTLFEKLIRLSPAIAVAGTGGLGILAIAVGGPFTLTLVLAAAAFVLPYLYFYHRSSTDLDFFFPNTNLIIKRNQLEEAIKTKDAYFTKVANDYADALVKKHALPSITPLDISDAYENALNTMDDKTGMKKKLKKVYAEKLDKKMQGIQKAKDKEFEKRWNSLKNTAAAPNSLTDPEWIEQQKLLDFKKFNDETIDPYRAPIMREIVMSFTETVDMSVLRRQVEQEVDQYFEAHPIEKQKIIEIKQTIVENRARRVMKRLIDDWLKKALASGAKEQFKSFYLSYKEEYAAQNVESILNRLQATKQKENKEALQQELKKELPLDFNREQIAEEIYNVREREQA